MFTGSCKQQKTAMFQSLGTKASRSAELSNLKLWGEKILRNIRT
jgi:hypothetical protein